PVKLFNYIQFNIDPTLAAVSAATIYLAVLVVVAIDLAVGIEKAAVNAAGETRPWGIEDAGGKAVAKAQHTLHLSGRDLEELGLSMAEIIPSWRRCSVSRPKAASCCRPKYSSTATGRASIARWSAQRQVWAMRAASGRAAIRRALRAGSPTSTASS